MTAISSPRIRSSLDEAVSPGAESLIANARERKLLRGVAIGVVRGED